jgi:AcrR family transcriptional regulator
MGEAVVRRLGTAARIEDVTIEAGAARATFYVYFPTWEDFLLALRDRALVSLAAEFRAALANDRDWRGRIAQLPDLIVDLTLSLEGWHATAFLGPVADRPRDSAFDLTAAVAGLLAEGSAAGALTVENVPETAHLVYAMLHQTADRVEKGEDRATAVAACQALLLRALDAKPVPVRRREPATP